MAAIGPDDLGLSAQEWIDLLYRSKTTTTAGVHQRGRRRSNTGLEPEWIELCHGISVTRLDCAINALKTDPLLAQAWHELGMLLHGDHPSVPLFEQHWTSVDCYLKCLELNPKFACAWHSLALLSDEFNRRGKTFSIAVNGQVYDRSGCLQKAAEFDNDLVSAEELASAVKTTGR